MPSSTRRFSVRSLVSLFRFCPGVDEAVVGYGSTRLQSHGVCQPGGQRRVDIHLPLLGQRRQTQLDSDEMLASREPDMQGGVLDVVRNRRR